ncbi:unnamed protein product, partial [Brenthis ino]
MFKLVVLLLASAVITEGTPPVARSLAEAAQKGNWDVLQSLLRENAPNTWAPALVANVKDLKKPDDNSRVFGHAVSTYHVWSNINGNVSEHSDGLEVLNDDGVVTSRHFTP